MIGQYLIPNLQPLGVYLVDEFFSVGDSNFCLAIVGHDQICCRKHTTPLGHDSNWDEVISHSAFVDFLFIGKFLGIQGHIGGGTNFPCVVKVSVCQKDETRVNSSLYGPGLHSLTLLAIDEELFGEGSRHLVSQPQLPLVVHSPGKQFLQTSSANDVFVTANHIDNLFIVRQEEGQLLGLLPRRVVIHSQLPATVLTLAKQYAIGGQ